MKYHFKIHRDRKVGYWAECLELDGCMTQGKDMKELRANMEEALAVYVREPVEGDYLASLPNPKIPLSRSVVEVSLDPKVAFGLLLRHERLKARKTQEEVQQSIGYRYLYSYQRLERQANPTLETLNRILQTFPRFPVQRLFT